MRSIQGPWLLYDNRDAIRTRCTISAGARTKGGASGWTGQLDCRLRRRTTISCPATYLERAGLTHYREANAPWKLRQPVGRLDADDEAGELEPRLPVRRLVVGGALSRSRTNSVSCSVHIAASFCTRSGCAAARSRCSQRSLLRSYNSQGPFRPVATNFQSPTRIARLLL